MQHMIQQALSSINATQGNSRNAHNSPNLGTQDGAYPHLNTSLLTTMLYLFKISFQNSIICGSFKAEYKITQIIVIQ